MNNCRHPDLIKRLLGVAGNRSSGSFLVRSDRRPVADWCVVKHALIGCRAALGGTLRTRSIARQRSVNLQHITSTLPGQNITFRRTEPRPQTSIDNQLMFGHSVSEICENTTIQTRTAPQPQTSADNQLMFGITIRHRRTEPRPETSTDNWLMFRHPVSEICSRTDKHTHSDTGSGLARSIMDGRHTVHTRSITCSLLIHTNSCLSTLTQGIIKLLHRGAFKLYCFLAGARV